MMRKISHLRFFIAVLFFRRSISNKVLLFHSKLSFKRSFNNSNAKKFVQCSPSHTKPVYTFSTTVKIGIGLSCGSILKILIQQPAHCKQSVTRLAGYKKHDSKDIKFDWKKLWMYLRPHLWHLIAAIIAALIVAVLNIQIPQIMGAVINIVAKFDTNAKFLEEVKLPALMLSSMYIAQSCFTFFYIYLLSVIGENVAFSMKTDLFNSIMKQDVSFFDEYRSGEVINRLTTDIQNFKSSFKQCISQGLRSGAQIIGCSISLIMISPEMTLVTMLCVPSVIFVGSIFGAVLRKLSRKSQDQMEKLTAVADEAVSNIHTIRGFAMENQEINLYN